MLSESLVVYAEFEREGYGYGMGMYGDNPALMREIRPHILAKPQKFLSLVTDPAFTSRFEVVGDSFKRPKFSDAPEGVLVDLVECALYDRRGVYADTEGEFFADSVARASALCQAAVLLPALREWPVDVLHAHDVQAALAPVYRRRWYAGSRLPGPAGTLLTIHNLAHQEIHDRAEMEPTGLPADLALFPGPFEFFGKLNLLKAGIIDSDLVNTVSPTYAREVVDDPAIGCGLEGVLAARGDAFVGILNGVDYAAWDPSRDPWLAAPYDARDLTGKTACRQRLLADNGLQDSQRPVLGLVGRLVRQKGLDLLISVLDRLIAGGFSLVVLGTGEAAYHEVLEAVAAREPGRVAFLPEFSEAKAHAIYAGSDLFLMPSRFEPCGLSQLYAMRYGTPPVVRRTGGLADTVTQANGDTGTGFMFDEDTPEALWGALERARIVFGDPDRWRRLQRRGMAVDFGWDAAADQYASLYRRLASGARNDRRSR